MFLKSYIYQEHCYTCSYASDHRAGDITSVISGVSSWFIRNCWRKTAGLWTMKRAASCLIVNNSRGQALLEKYGSGIRCWASNIPLRFAQGGGGELVVVFGRVFISRRSLSRERYEKVEAWYRRWLIPIKIRRAIRAAIPRKVKDTIKNALGRQTKEEHIRKVNRFQNV